MPATIYDIAEGAEVSIATVSRVLNGHPRVSDATRERVADVARRLGYAPNASARSLATQRTGLVSVVVPMMTSSFFMEVIRGVQSRLDDSDHDLLIYVSRTVERVEDQLDRALQRGRSDGLLLISCPVGDDRAEALAASRQPVALVDSFHPQFDSVSVDNRRGGAVATEHLIERGHRRVGLLLPVESSEPARRRRAGYEDALAAAGLALDPALVVAADWDHDHDGYTRFAGYRAMQTLLDRLQSRPDKRPTAVFAAADVLAFGARRALREAGLADAVEVVGFDDVEPSAYAGLTTLRQPMAAMGRLAADLLLRRMEAPPDAPQHVVFAPKLVVRETTGGSTTEA